ncbi:hypothetical protein [Cesiribacter sp. SM1]|uniref:hypothetical protein n=1 Tax=Cesiribacter sp. SM1 TaxID=2861196 RepID=UPI001CD1F7CD|nr:hypothetical protein [Cesiribacter sp. SM1]
MEATCNHCTHWEQTQAKLDVPTDKFGKCNELSDAHVDPEYIVPVLNDGRPVSEKNGHYEYITGADFGCNHFAEKMNRITF